MADAQRSGSNWIPAAVALVAVAGFMIWLATREPPASVAVIEPGDTTADTLAQGGPAQTIEPEVLNQTATARELIGQDVQLSSVTVSDVLGTQMFWIELPPGNAPYLVKLDSAQIASGIALPAPGSSVSVTGRVTEKTAALLDGWRASGALQDDNQRMLAEFGSTFIEARRVAPAGS
jgi:hypothetical protein